MTDFRKTSKKYDRAIILGLILSAGFINALPASAQGRLKSEFVTVDLSVLNNAGGSTLSPAVATSGMGFGHNILPPPSRIPLSKFHLGPVSNNFSSNLSTFTTVDTGQAPTLTSPPLVAKKSSIAATPSAMSVMTQPELAVKMPESPASSPDPIVKAPDPEVTAPVALAKSEPEVAPAPPPSPVIEVAKETVEPILKKAADPVPVVKTTIAPPPPAPTVATKTIDEPDQDVTTQASLTPGEIPSGPGQSLLLKFQESDSKISSESKAELSALAALIKDDKELRLQLMAYAGGEEITAGKARRLSLSRALSIRSFLIENGIRSTRIDVRALGNKTSKDPINRVDVKVTKR